MTLPGLNQIQNNSDDSEFMPLKNQRSFKKKKQFKEKPIQKVNQSPVRQVSLNNTGSWNMNEERKFLQHMKKNQNIYQEKRFRKKYKIFKKMSKSLKSRTSEQCRSHHQMLELKFKCYHNIIKVLENKIVDPYLESQSSFDGIHYSPIIIPEFMLFQKDISENLTIKKEQEIFQEIEKNKCNPKIRKEQFFTKFQKQIQIGEKNEVYQFLVSSNNQIMIKMQLDGIEEY